MGVNIVFEYPAWFIVFCVLLGAGYAFFLYRKERRFEDVSPWIIRSMAVFRFLAVTIIAILLLSPLIKTNFREVEKPIILFAQDNSESVIINEDSTFYKNEYLQATNELTTQLADKYEVKQYAFGANVESSDEVNYSAKQTDISAFFNEAYNLYGNRNVGAVILASDGLFNKGTNPLYAIEKVKAPVYTIALGDTSVRKDLVLSRVNHNRYAYLGNKFPLEVMVDARQCEGAATILTVSRDGETLFTEKLNIGSEQYNKTIPVLLEAREPGLQRYRVRLSGLEDELSYENNVTDIFIEVLDSRQKILILAAVPHPDVGAIRDAIEVNDNYDVEVFLADKFDKNLDAYNLVILHQLPAAGNASNKIFSQLRQAAVPSFYIIGTKTRLEQFNQLNTGLKIRSNNNTNEVQAVFRDNFTLFNFNTENGRDMEEFPPLISPFGDYNTSAGAQVLLNQKIGMVKTDQPLLLFSQREEAKTAVLSGEGFWRWRLTDYAQHGNHDISNGLISKIVQYLSVKADKSQFRVSGKNHFLENEPIIFDAELYNESYELINEPEVRITITNSEGKNFPFTFGRTANAYKLNAGNFPAGEYNYVAQVKYGEEIYKESGEFSVSGLHVEANNTVADHQLLYNLAVKTGGKMFYPNEINELQDEILNREDIKPVIYNEKKLEDVIHLKWIFFLILALLAGEWFMRKRSGAY